MTRKRQLISSDEGYTSKVQHTKPCSDCPMARSALPGWLGGASAEEYRQLAHSDAVVDCHVITNQQCAGMAIYRSNVCKSVHGTSNLKLPRDTEKVFATPMEFMDHHDIMKRKRVRHAN
jgi:hypothetical protein